MDYKPGDGKILYETFVEMDKETTYTEYPRLAKYSQDKWEKIAEEYLSRLDDGE